MKIDVPKLHESMTRDWEVLRPFREVRYDMIQELAGGNYGKEALSDQDARDKKPVNLTSLYVRTMSAYLLGSDPRMMVSSQDRRLWPLTSAMESWGNLKLKEMEFGETINNIFIDAFFLLGILRIAIASPTESRFTYGKVGKVHVSRISFEDFGYDTHASTFKECDYIFHRYRVLYDDVKNSKLFSAKARKNLRPMEQGELNPTGDERALSISRGRARGDEEYLEKVELIECYFPREQRVVTFEATEPQELLLDQEWVGPKCGPYLFHSYQRVPDQTLPKGVLMDLVDLDRSINVLWTKNDFQASIQKKLNLFRDTDKAKELEKARDGDWVQSSDPTGGVSSLSLNGPDQVVGVWTQGSIDQWMELGGGIRTLAGLGASADTATQEKLIAGNASTVVNGMALANTRFINRVFEALGWFWWNSPDEEMRETRQAPGVPWASVEKVVRPVDRIGVPYEKLDVKFDPYSVSFQTPQQKFMVTDKFFKEVFIPLLPMFNQPGVSGMLEKYIKMAAKYFNNPDLLELLDELVGVEGAQQEQSGESHERTMPNETTRTYERVSRPGMTDEGNRQKIQQALAGIEPTNGKMAG